MNKAFLRQYSILAFFLVLLPICLGFWVLHLWAWDFTVPMAYGNPGADEIWQLVATKTLLETGWVLQNPFMGAPDISTWYANSASQISVVHSALMLVIGWFVKDAIAVQQYYFVVNFSLITIASYALGRTLGISKALSISVGLIFSLTSYRLNSLFFAYLANYFVVPISMIPVYWTLMGKYCAYVHTDESRRAFKQRLFLGLLIAALTAISDGYYAFFFLLVLAFAMFVRLINGDARKYKNLAAPALLVFTTLLVSVAITMPLREHRNAFPQEANQDLIKQATDAEVYTPTLKLLVTPIQNHRLKIFGDAGAELLRTANFNRRFPYTNGAPAVLGLGGTFLLLGALILLLVYRRPASQVIEVDEGHGGLSAVGCSVLLAVFILLCSITGGIGTLIAMFFPAIRAYERFPLFLVLVLYIGGAAYATPWMLSGGRILKTFKVVLAVGATALVILDQSPKDLLRLNVLGSFEERTERFLAERAFIHKIEQAEVAGAMIYQFPYSQYLTDNRYYGWGQFGHLRAYLHSKQLRWSNGAAKGSFVDRWHESKARLPIPLLLSEMQALGFQGVLVDRLVVKDDEFKEISAQLTAVTGREPLQSEPAKMAYWHLPASPIRVKYSENFEVIDELTVRSDFDASSVPLPRMIDREQLAKVMERRNKTYPFTVTRTQEPSLFKSSDYVTYGLGETKMNNDLLAGGLQCSAHEEKARVPQEYDLKISNRTKFDWLFDSGTFPLRVGVIVTDSAGKAYVDTRIKVDKYLFAGESLNFKYNLGAAMRTLKEPLPAAYHVSIKLVQDGYRWFDNPALAHCELDISGQP